MQAITHLNKREQIYKAMKQRTAVISQSQLSRMIPGVNSSSISLIITRKWENISDKIWNRIAAYLKIDNWQLIETTNFLTIQELSSDAQTNSRFLGLAAGSGLGKTESFNGYVKKYNNAFYLMADILMSGKGQFLTAVQCAMGFQEGKTSADMFLAITRRLNELDSPLLIIDDAGKLNDSSLRLIQLIYDSTVRRCGIIMAGTEYLKLNMERGRRLNKMGYEELYRRIEMWQKLELPSPEEIKALAVLNGLHNEKVINAITRVEKNFGSIRASIENALKLQRKNALTIESFAKNSASLNS